MRLVFAMICLLALLPLVGCTHSGSTENKNGDKDDFDFGQEMFQALRNYFVDMENGELKAATWDRHEQQVVDAINTIFEGEDVTKPFSAMSERERESFVEAFLALIDDDILPDFTDAIGELLKETAADVESCRAVADFMNTKVGIDFDSFIALVRTALKYEEFRELAAALATVVERHPDFLHDTLYLLSESLSHLPANEHTRRLFEVLATDIGQWTDDPQFRGTAHPVWLTRLDANENPAVSIDPQSKTVFPPFVDYDFDGVCDVDEQGQPIDSDGNALDIPAFSTEEYSDSSGKTLIFRDQSLRAVSPSGNFVFSYYDAQNTVLASLLATTGKALRQNCHRDLHKVLRKALLPMKEYSDASGKYLGYSDDGNLHQAVIDAIRLLDDKKARDLLRGYAILLRRDPQGAKVCFTGLAKMMWAVRDKELKDPLEMTLYISWLLVSGEVPELQRMFDVMATVEIEGSGFWNMRDLFNAFLFENLTPLCADVLWPLRSSLRQLADHYPQDPQLAERLGDHLIEIICDTAPPTPQTGPVVALVLDTFVEVLEQDPNSVDKLEQLIYQVWTSRALVVLMNNLEKLANAPEGRVIDTALIHFLTPHDDAERDTYGRLVRIGVGFLQCKSDIETRVRLLKMAGKALDPEQRVVVNMLESFGRLISASEGGEVILQAMRAAFYQCQEYRRAPVSLITHAVVDTFQAGKPHHGQKTITDADIAELGHLSGKLLTDPDGMLKRLYKIIKERRD